MSRIIVSTVAALAIGFGVAATNAEASPQYTVVSYPYSAYYYAPTYGYYYPSYAYYPPNYGYVYAPAYYPYRTYWYGGGWSHPWHSGWGWRYWR